MFIFDVHYIHSLVGPQTYTYTHNCTHASTQFHPHPHTSTHNVAFVSEKANPLSAVTLIASEDEQALSFCQNVMMYFVDSISRFEFQALRFPVRYLKEGLYSFGGRAICIYSCTAV